MDIDVAPVYPHLREFLPEERPPRLGERPLFIHSLRFVENYGGCTFLLARCLLLDDRTTVDLMVSGLSFYLSVPAQHQERVAAAAQQAGSLRKSARLTLFNGERKAPEEHVLYVYACRAAQLRACRAIDELLKGVPETAYTFGDHAQTQDGNTVAVCNNVLCSRTYHARGQLLRPGGELAANDLVFCRQADADNLRGLDRLLPWIRRQGAFDLETLMGEGGPETDCPRFFDEYFRDYRRMFDIYERLRTAHPSLQLDRPPADQVVMKRHRVLSVSLVVANHHLPKPRRKELFVIYDASFPQGPPPDPLAYRERAAELRVDMERVQLVPAASEYHLLEAFLRLLVQKVDTLYVYHANFDLSVLLQRMRYYSARRGNPCCPWHRAHARPPEGPSLLELWQNFLSKQPEVCRGWVLLGNDLLRRSYLNFVRGVQDLMASPSQSYPQKMAEVRRRKDEYLTAKGKVQNLKSHCYGAEVVDLHLVVNQARFDDCKNGKLDTKADYIIGKMRPGKAAVKRRKLGDVSYDKLDEWYRAGGRQLTECLIYNLIDSLLLIRIARCLGPLSEYIYRQVSTLNMDQLVHTRGQMQFHSFVGSVKSVDISRLKARLDLGVVLSTGCLRNHLYRPEVIARRGGYVMTPLTGLSFSSPGLPFESIVDFASLYPSIMCDLNISPETVVDHGREAEVAGYLCYDWSGVEGGFKKYTLVLRLERPADGGPARLTRHHSDTAASLRRYLDMRVHHKRELKRAVDPLDRLYHNKLQTEMKICANSHYGVSEQTCSLMTTTQGQHRIKLVNKTLYGQNMFPNYGDTDSTMFWTPPDDERPPPTQGPPVDEPQLWERCAGPLLAQLADFIGRRVRATQLVIERFLERVGRALFDDDMSRMVLLVPGHPPARPFRAHDDTWWVTDPLDGRALAVEPPYRRGYLTKLEYENCSSVTCHVAKKMYVCLVHELGRGGRLESTAVKKRGMTGFKTSRFGATETITRDFIELIFRGEALTRVRQITRFLVRPWHQLTTDDVVMLLTPDELARGRPAAQLRPHRVVRLQTTPAADGDYRLTAVLLRPETGEGPLALRLHLYQQGHALTHIYDQHNAAERELAFVTLARYRAVSVATGMVPWRHLVRYARVSALKEEYKQKRRSYGLHSGKDLKLAYVTLIDKRTRLYEVLGNKNVVFPPEWAKQDPAVAFMRHYPVNVNLDTLMRDYFGPGFRCAVPNFEPRRLRLDDDELLNQLHVKSFMDTEYFNDNSKCLVHVLADYHGVRTNAFEGDQAALDREVARVTGLVLACKEEFGRLIESGRNIFYTIHVNVPAEMLLTTCATDESAFAYSLERDRAAAPLDRDLRSMLADDDYVEVLYDQALVQLRALLPRLRDLVRFAPAHEAPTNKTLTVLPPQLARALDTAPQLVLICDSTESPLLIDCAQFIYYALLGLHAKVGPALESHPPAVACLRAPPPRASRGALKEFFRGLAAYIRSRQAHPEGCLSHCSGCQQFWLSTSPERVIAERFTFDGARFHLRQPSPCSLHC